MTSNRLFFLLIVGLLLPLMAATQALTADSEKDPESCLVCHDKYAKHKVVHKAVNDACMDCHDAMESPFKTPHKSGGKAKNGISAALPELCFACHAKNNFEGKFKHDPTVNDECAECHDSHGTDNFALLTKQPSETCAECHGSLKKQKHMLAGFSGKSHPVGFESGDKILEDPSRKGKPFYCGSCHEPHRSGFGRLMRVDVKSGAQFCLKCHEM